MCDHLASHKQLHFRKPDSLCTLQYRRHSSDATIWIQTTSEVITIHICFHFPEDEKSRTYSPVLNLIFLVRTSCQSWPNNETRLYWGTRNEWHTVLHMEAMCSRTCEDKQKSPLDLCALRVIDVVEQSVLLNTHVHIRPDGWNGIYICIESTSTSRMYVLI